MSSLEGKNPLVAGELPTEYRDTPRASLLIGNLNEALTRGVITHSQAIFALGEAACDIAQRAGEYAPLVASSLMSAHLSSEIID